MAAITGHERLTSALRLVVAAAGLLIFIIDPSEHPMRRPFAQGVLVAFVAYSVVLYVLALRRSRHVPQSVAPWLDVGWITLLVAASEATSSIFYPLYLFAFFNASFERGFRAGIAIVLVSVASFAGIGMLTSPEEQTALAPYVIRPLYLLVLGYLTAVWGGYEVRSRRRLALLRQVTELSNPRFGIDRAVERLMEAVRLFYDADSCRLVVAEEQADRRWIRTAARSGTTGEIALPQEPADVLLAAPAEAAVLLRARPRPLRGPELRLELHRPGGAAPQAGDPALAVALAELLEAGALVSVPFRYHSTASARLYVVRRRHATFDAAELDFLRHLLEQFVPVLESIRLVDRLVWDAAEEERLRIARDLHDSVIQPYLGLRLGLSAAGTALAGGDVVTGRAQVSRLLELADGEIQTLRGYVRDLRAGGTARSAGLLTNGVRRFCERFTAATGIEVAVSMEGQPLENERLAAEVFQMVTEALSNVRRHTSAARAEVRIAITGERLHLSVANEASGAPPFSPRSLTERAAALGGSVRIDTPPGGRTAVHVEIPL